VRNVIETRICKCCGDELPLEKFSFCNKGLGLFQENTEVLSKAIEYLKETYGIESEGACKEE